jgi:hypothetical protein
MRESIGTPAPAADRDALLRTRSAPPAASATRPPWLFWPARSGTVSGHRLELPPSALGSNDRPGRPSMQRQPSTRTRPCRRRARVVAAGGRSGGPSGTSRRAGAVRPAIGRCTCGPIRSGSTTATCALGSSADAILHSVDSITTQGASGLKVEPLSTPAANPFCGIAAAPQATTRSCPRWCVA